MAAIGVMRNERGVLEGVTKRLLRVSSSMREIGLSGWDGCEHTTDEQYRSSILSASLLLSGSNVSKTVVRDLYTHCLIIIHSLKMINTSYHLLASFLFPLLCSFNPSLTQHALYHC